MLSSLPGLVVKVFYVVVCYCKSESKHFWRLLVFSKTKSQTALLYEKGFGLKIIIESLLKERKLNHVLV